MPRVAVRREGVIVVRVGIMRARLRQIHALPGEEGRAGGEPLARECPVALTSHASTQEEDGGETDEEQDEAADSRSSDDSGP